MRRLYILDSTTPLILMMTIGSIILSFLTLGMTMFSLKDYGFSGVSPTGSMYPTIKTGDTVIINWDVSRFIDRNLTGEVIIFGKMNIAHRVIWDNGTWLHTRGDAFTTGGEYLTRDEIKGLFIQVSTNKFMEMLRYGWTG